MGFKIRTPAVTAAAVCVASVTHRLEGNCMPVELQVPTSQRKKREMVQRAEALLEKARSKDGSVKLTALRKIKNQVIGNKRRKAAYIELNAAESVAGLLSEVEASKVRLESALVLSSLSRLTSSGDAIASSDAIPQLLKMVDSSEESLIETALTAICNICEVGQRCCIVICLQLILPMFEHS